MALVSGYSGRRAAGASVRDARTGAVTDRVQPPAGESFMRVTSAGQGVFFLTGSGPRGDSRPVYRLQVDADGRAGQLAPVPGDLLPPGCRHIAASPGGTILAYTVPDMTPPPSTAEAGVVDLTTGERRIASLPAGSIGALSLANDGQVLAFQWQPRSGGDPDVYVAAAASDWVSQGSALTALDGLPYDAISPVINADGRTVYLTVAEPEPAGGAHWNRLLEVPAGGGQPRVLFELRYQPNSQNFTYMWGTVCRDPAGEWLLAFSSGYAYLIEISSGAVNRLPFPKGQPYDAAW